MLITLELDELCRGMSAQGEIQWK